MNINQIEFFYEYWNASNVAGKQTINLHALNSPARVV